MAHFAQCHQVARSRRQLRFLCPRVVAQLLVSFFASGAGLDVVSDL
jgi:hypothetical protein